MISRTLVSLAVTPVKQVTSVWIMVKNWENNGMEEIHLVTPTPPWSLPDQQQTQYWTYFYNWLHFHSEKITYHILNIYHILNMQPSIPSPNTAAMHCDITYLNVNLLWPNDAIWWHRFGSTMAQVMAWCLTAPSHHLNQCWLIITAVQ